MAKGRMIPATTFDDRDFGKMSSAAKVMFLGIIVFADDLGRLRGDADYLASHIFTYQHLSHKKAQAIRDEVVTSIKSCLLYKVGDEEFIQLTKWEKYQKLRTDRDHISDFPPPDNQCHTNDIPKEVKRVLNRIEVNRIETKRREGKCEGKGNLPLRGRNLLKKTVKEISGNA